MDSNDFLNKEIEIRFGTPTPVPFKASRTGLDLHLRAFGNATIVVKDASNFTSLDDVKKKGAVIVSDSFAKAIGELSMNGSLDASALGRSINEISKKTAANTNKNGITATSVSILSLNPDTESEKKLKEKIREIVAKPMSDDHPVSRPMTDDFGMMPVTKSAVSVGNPAAGYPKFCTYCGAKAGSRFCPNCGAKLV